MISTIRFSAAAFALLLTGCAAPVVVYHPVALTLPPRPVVPAVDRMAVQCLAPETYTALVNRERGYKTWGLELEAIIKANNERAGARSSSAQKP